jgi:hypothetical protein
VTPCSPVDEYQCFGRTWCFHLQGRGDRTGYELIATVKLPFLGPQYFHNRKETWIYSPRGNTLRTWRWTKYVAPKHLYPPTRLAGVPTQKKTTRTVTTITTWKLMFYWRLFSGCDAVQSGSLLTFRSNVQHPFSGSTKSSEQKPLGLHFDGRMKALRSYETSVPAYRNPRKWYSL